MTISVGFHFATPPTITHKDFPATTDRPGFTAVCLTEGGVDHMIYLPLGCRLEVKNMVTEDTP